MKAGFIFIGLVLFASVSASAKVSIQKDVGQTRYHFEVEGVDFHKETDDDGTVFVQPSLRGVDGFAGILYRDQGAELPVIRFFVDGPGTIDVQPGPARTEVSRDRAPWKPSMDSASKCGPGKIRALAQPVPVDAFEPAQIFDIARLGTVRGVLRRLVTLYPVRYNAARHAYLLVEKFEVHTPSAPAAASTPEGETLAVVVSPALAHSPALTRYLAFKASLGYTVRTFLASQPAEIRARLGILLSDANHPLRYVLLVGGAKSVPSPKSQFVRGITDHYYASLEGPYADDIGTPDVEVGRFAVDTETDLAAVVEKQLHYERGNFADVSWLNRLSFLGTHDKTHWPLVEAGLNHALRQYTIAQGYRGSFPLPGEPGGDKLFATSYHASGAEALARFSEGRALIDYSGHGHWDRWDGPRIEKADLAKIPDQEATPFIISCACHTGMFLQDSFAQAWQRLPQGSIVFWGAMDTSHWAEDDIVQRVFYDFLFGGKSLEVSAMTRAALDEVWRVYGGAHRSRYYWDLYTTFGDPTTRIRTRVPRALVVTGADAWNGEPVVKLEVRDSSGAPVVGARVALSRGNFHRVNETSQEGRAQSATPAGPGPLTITISGDNLRLWERTFPAPTR